MLRQFYPDVRMDSVHRINFDRLYADGYRGLIFDIDNTLVPHGAPANESAIALFDHLKELGFSCCLLSNNDEPRVKMFNDAVQVDYIFKAHKPMPDGYRRAMEVMHTDQTNTAFIGDQIFTDIWGAKRAGLRTFMVKKIYWKEEIQIIFKRILEAVVLAGYWLYVRRRGTSSPDAPLSLKARYEKEAVSRE